MKSLQSFLLCAGLYMCVATAANAAVLEFDPTSFSGTSGSTFDVDIVLNPGTDAVSGADVYINFDDSVASVTNVQVTDLFDQTNYSTTDSQVYLNGIFLDPTSTVTAEGVMATVSFRLNSASASALEFYCDKTQNDTSKIVKNDANATNVIECNTLGAFSINGGSAGAIPQPTQLPASGTSTTSSTTGVTPTLTPITIYKQGVPTTLPASGIFDNVLRYSIPGIVMVAVGVAIKFFL